MARNKFDVDENLESPFQLAHLKRAFKYIKRYRWILVLSLVLAVIGSLSSLFVPKISEWVMDDIIPAKGAGRGGPEQGHRHDRPDGPAVCRHHRAEHRLYHDPLPHDGPRQPEYYLRYP